MAISIDFTQVATGTELASLPKGRLLELDRKILDSGSFNVVTFLRIGFGSSFEPLAADAPGEPTSIGREPKVLDAAGLPSGGFVVVFATEKEQFREEIDLGLGTIKRQFLGVDHDLRIAYFDAAGVFERSVPVASVFVDANILEPFIDFGYTDAAATSLTGGLVAVSYAQSSGATSENGTRVFDAAGNEVDALRDANGLFSGPVASDTLADGRVVTVQASPLVPFGTSDISFRIGLDPATEIQGQIANSGDREIDPDVAGLANGRFVTVWQRETSDNSDLYFEIRSATGELVGDSDRRIAFQSDDMEKPRVTALANGGFLVVWHNRTNSVIEAETFSSAGVSAGDRTVIRTGVTDVVDIEAVTTTDGRVVVLVGDTTNGSTLIHLDPRGASFSATSGNDTIVRHAPGSTIRAGDGHDTVIIDDGNVFVSLPVGDHRLFGESGNDTLKGGRGKDTLDGGIGTDRLEGGAGDDILIGGADADELIGGADTDTADYSASALPVTIDLSVTVDALGRSLGAGGDAQGDLLSSIENIKGSRGDDRITGDNRNNQIEGGNGRDTLRGGFGVDTILGGEGDDVLEGDPGRAPGFFGIGFGGPDYVADVLNGGIGRDRVTYERATEAATASLTASSRNAGAAAGDTFQLIEDLTGSIFDDFLEGNGFSNLLDGGRGNDRLRGMAGADELIGGIGFDTADYAGSSAAVTIDLAAGIIAGGHATGDTFSGIENVTGSAFADTLTGDSGDNVLEGGAGADKLTGGGNLISIGSLTGDMLSYASSNAGVFVSLETRTASGGHAAGDVFTGFQSIEGSAFGDRLQGDGGRNFLRGNAGNDTMGGGGDVDILDGGAGDDRLEGGEDSDRYIGFNLAGSDDIIVDTGGVGDRIEIDALSDLVSSSRVGNNLVLKLTNSASVTIVNHFTATGSVEFLKAGLDQLVLATGMVGGNASGIISGTARGDIQYGGGGDDLLFGERGNDRLFGDEGNDSLFDGDGRDVLTGGQGADSFHLARDRSRDQIADFESGIDRILFDAAAFGIDASTAVESWLFFDIDDLPDQSPAFLVDAWGKILFFERGPCGSVELVAELSSAGDIPGLGDFGLY